jgi:hypothetical protein
MKTKKKMKKKMQISYFIANKLKTKVNKKALSSFLVNYVSLGLAAEMIYYT